MPETLFAEWMTRGFPRVGDVLFTTEAPLGNVCRIPNLYGRFAVGQRIVTMQVMKEVLDPSYLEHALKSDSFQRKIKQKSSGSTVTGIRSKLLEKLTVPIPPLALQQEFAAFVEKVDKLAFKAKASLEKLETLKKAMMQKYFN
jgi:type I restriction enzyme S subunit